MLMACVVPEGPLHLASYSFDDRSGKNARSYQTLVPLAVFTGRNIRVFPNAAERSEKIVRELVVAPEFEGGTVVMAWEHRHLPELARGLGWSRMPRIRDDDFDGLWLLRYSGQQGEPAVSQFSLAELRRQDCFRASSPAGHPLQHLSGQLLLPLNKTSGGALSNRESIGYQGSNGVDVDTCGFDPVDPGDDRTHQGSDCQEGEQSLGAPLGQEGGKEKGCQYCASFADGGR